MSKRPKTTPTRIRTAAALKADARLLSGARSRVALAVADGEGDPAPDAGTKVGELWLYGIVGGWWRGFDAESVSRALRAMGDIDVLHVRIHSPGGIAQEGVAIANLLRNFDAQVITVIDGTAASAASVIAVAGDEVVMCPGAQLMLHDASTGMYLYGNAEDLRSQVVELQRLVDWIDHQSENYAGMYAYKAGGTAAEWRQVMTGNGIIGQWYTGEEAVAAKLADRVGTITAVGSPPVAPDEEIDDLDDLDDELLARVEHDLQLLEHHVPAAARAAWQGNPAKPATKPAPKPPNASAVGSTHTQGGSAVTFSDEQLTTMRESLELEETADEAAILAAVQAVVAENLEERPTTETAGDGDVVVPEVRLKDLETAAASGVAAMQKLQAMERDAFLDAHKSKYPATSRADWSKRYDKNPEGTRELLSAAADLVPTGELGHESDGLNREDGGNATLDDIRSDDNYKNWRM
ncbi:head maturation protease, ClpP-related [Nocardioides sp.]|uniref:head maturation protease, ClpP-related n=1 Tax=Nocardioides sp. TaxID=35761 RepID=UPI002BE11967|nr:head maturation protease, ClpP-related [Nocardioides sp.]HXH77307.1 head maturation protease, ClpP-related [Nocardioides sp.]